MRTYFVSRSFGLFAAVIFGGAGIVARAGGVAPADATLSSLAVSAGTLTPSFAPGVTSYTDNVPTLTEFLTVTPTAADPAALITVNGTPVASGTASAPLALAWGDNPIIVVVSALNGTAVGYAINAIRPASLSFAFASADAVAVTADGYAATGKTAALSLGFAPAVGTRLTVVNNTGGSPIIGRFANLAQDQTITLPFGNARFRFTANYFGGTGNDLVLEWGIHTAYGWGKNTNGQLGNGGTSNGLVPGAISPGALAGKTVVALALGASHSLALCADGTLAAWGANNDGQLGNGTTTSSSVPVAVTATGALAGKFVTAIAASTYHNLALCTDGTVVAWGDGSYGQLGNGGTADSNVPVPVTTTTGVLAGQKVVALATGASHSLALCADGTLATWGNNLNGQLGNGTTNNSSLPEAVTATGVLAGRTPIAIVAGFHHNLALCSNGTVVAWGYGGYFNLGNGSTENRSVPVNVTTTGVLAGRAVATIAAGGNHNLALCTDGTLVSWGFNPRGQLGNTGTTNSSLPVLVTTTSGALVGKTVAAIGAGGSHSYAISSDGSLAAWGDNGSGQLGDNSTTSSSVPVAVATSTLPNGTRIGPLAVGSQASHTMALMALPLSSNSALAGLAVSPGVFEQAFAPGATGYSVRVLHGTTAVRLTPTAADADAAVTVNGIRVVSGTASPPVPWSPGNPPVTVRVTAQNGNSTDYQVTFREDATLAGLSLSSGSPTPTLAPGTTSYTAHVGTATTAVAVTPTATDPAATITVNGQAVASGSASEPISLAPGTTPITVAVTATDGTTVSYTIIVLRPGPLDFTFTAPGDVAATWVGYTATGNTVNLTLGFTPAGPVNLTVIDNTGPNPVVGRFANLAQGQVVNFIRNGITYSFVADYYGGTGNDLVLRWAITKAYAWGYNTSGQLGNGTTTNGSLPAAVTSTGILAGRTISTLARGDSHSLALCTDGTLAAWGSNTYGQLGTGNKVASTVPVAVVTTGTLAGKTIISIAAGTYHSLALCADGTVVGWGRSGSGQIGASDSTVPVAMPATGALAGKTVIGIAAGCLHSLALCADGCLVGWGWNGKGQLGNGRTDSVVSIPVAVTTSGVLAGKTVLAIAAGYGHSLALAADGTVAAWGFNSDGQLGNGTTTNSSVPVAVTATGVLAGKTITAIAAGNGSNNALCTDGTLAAWGFNESGQLGNGTTTSSSLPVAVTTTGLGSGEKFTLLAAGPGANHMLALVATPLSGNSALAGLALDTGTLSPAFAPGVTTYVARVTHGTAAIRVTPVVAETHATVTVNGALVASGTASPPLQLSPGNQTFTIRVTAQNGTTTTYVVTVRDDSTLVGLSLSAGTLGPAFAAETTAYSAFVTTDTATMTVTPTAKDPSATLTVNGTVVPSGAASGPLALAPGSNSITVIDTALDGAVTTYTVTVIRQVPLAAAFASAAMVPLTAAGYTATSNTVNFSLNYAPVTGTTLTVINNTGRDFITDRFSNLAQGQVVTLVFNNASYRFVANYYGGTGNDLVLQWANVKPYTWGGNGYGQLGNGTTTSSSRPGSVITTGVLAGKTILTVAAGFSHTVALCADGTLATWGQNSDGQLGNGTFTNSSVPVAVTNTGVLAGKTVVAIAVGSSSNYALCADGTLVAWGDNGSGALGNGSTSRSSTPVAVTTTGVLAGKTIRAIAAGGPLVLCTDGTLATWGYNHFGQLGNGTNTNSSVPVAVTTGSGVLAGKTISAIAAGGTHKLVLCTDGTLAAWGNNTNGQLGDGTTNWRSIPVAVTTTGILSGKTVTHIAAGGTHSLVRCSDGTLAAWGYNNNYQLGTGNRSSSSVPVAVVTTGVLAGKTVTALSSGHYFNMVRCSDGSLAAWGYNDSGQLGIGSTTNSSVPVTVSTTTLGAGETFIAGAAGLASGHSVGLAAVPLGTVATLSALAATPGTLSPAFASGTTSYTLTVPGDTPSVSLTPTATDPNATIRINEVAVASGSPGPAVALAAGSVTVTVRVTAQNGVAATYTVRLNRMPAFPGYTLGTPYQTQAAIHLSKLLAKTTDADGDAFTVLGAGPTSAKGGTAVLQSGRILYTPPLAVSDTDSFAVTIQDARGAATVGTVTVTVGPAPNAGGVGVNPPVLTTLPDGKMGIAFHGIPGRAYAVQRSVSGLDNWLTLATVTADASGKVAYTDDSPPAGSAFYRLGLP